WDELFEVIEEGASRGASTITQQVAKNVFLWHERSYLRKAIEIVFALGIEAFWSKERIIEVYLNVAEFDEGVFGIEAASLHYFGVSAADISPLQAARLASILPDPKDRSASNPGNFTRQKALSVRDGAETIRLDGRADCFE
ncbi:MAG: transglycosylase domain-containing protein, partial [Pseudomonadota bacterium]